MSNGYAWMIFDRELLPIHKRSSDFLNAISKIIRISNPSSEIKKNKNKNRFMVSIAWISTNFIEKFFVRDRHLSAGDRQNASGGVIRKIVYTYTR